MKMMKMMEAKMINNEQDVDEDDGEDKMKIPLKNIYRTKEMKGTVQSTWQ